MAAYLQRLRTPGAFQALLAEKNAFPRKTIVIDYSSPNIAKQFHVGNLRSTLIGAFFDRIHRLLGHEVISVNYLGDWGTQFALIASYWPQVRPSQQYWNSLSDIDKLRSLTDCYVVANQRIVDDEQFRAVVRETFIKMEKDILSKDFSNETMQLWRDIRSISEKHLLEFYKLLNIQFDHWLCESELVGEAHKQVDRLVEKNLLRKTNDGLLVLDHPSNKKYSILRKSDHSSLYLTREIAAIIGRDKTFAADRYFYVVDKAQKQHFEALRVILDRMGKSDLAAKLEHIPFGRVKGLSTRRGRTEAVGDIIKNGTELALEFMNSSKTIKVANEDRQLTAEQLSISTIVFNDLKRAKNSEYEFSFKNAFDLDHNNALHLQMKHSRLFSIESRNSELLNQLADCTTIPDNSPEVDHLISMLHKLKEVTINSADLLEPCQFTLYLVELSQCIGTVAAQLKVKGQPTETAIPRLLLLSSARYVLYNGMHLLGMTPVNRM